MGTAPVFFRSVLLAIRTAGRVTRRALRLVLPFSVKAKDHFEKKSLQKFEKYPLPLTLPLNQGSYLFHHQGQRQFQVYGDGGLYRVSSNLSHFGFAMAWRNTPFGIILNVLRGGGGVVRCYLRVHDI